MQNDSPRQTNSVEGFARLNVKIHRAVAELLIRSNLVSIYREILLSKWYVSRKIQRRIIQGNLSVTRLRPKFIGHASRLSRGTRPPGENRVRKWFLLLPLCRPITNFIRQMAEVQQWTIVSLVPLCFHRADDLLPRRADADGRTQKTSARRKAEKTVARRLRPDRRSERAKEQYRNCREITRRRPAAALRALLG